MSNGRSESAAKNSGALATKLTTARESDDGAGDGAALLEHSGIEGDGVEGVGLA